MEKRLAPLAAVVAILAFLAWLGWLTATPDDETGPDSMAPSAALRAPSDGAGSAVPCAVPLAWRLARLDPGFGISRSQAVEAISEGAALWGNAVGRTILPRDSAGGFPIRMVYDDRQARTVERRRLEEAMSRSGADLEERRRAIMADRARLDSMESAHLDRVARLQERVELHNAEVRRWNERDDPERAGGLHATGETLAAEREALERERLALLDGRRELEARRARHEGDLEEHGQRVDSIRSAFPPTAVESGRYREAIRMEGRDTLSVSREIRIHRFDDLDDLRLIAAHELGHALGLSHTDADGALMGRTYDWRRLSQDGAAALTSADAALLRDRCPALGTG